MPEAVQESKQEESAEQVKPKEPVKKVFKPVETDQYKEFMTLNGAVRRDIK